MTYAVVFGISAGIIDLISFYPYIRSILRGETKPQRAAFAIWSLVGILTLFSYFASGARDTIWLVLVYSVMQLFVFGLSFKYGMGGLSKLDISCMFLALLGATLWIVTRNPLTALYCSIFIETLGFIPIIRKVFMMPETENTPAWTLSIIAAILNLFAITTLSLQIALYPFVMVIAEGIVVTLLFLSRVKRKDPLKK